MKVQKPNLLTFSLKNEKILLNIAILSTINKSWNYVLLLTFILTGYILNNILQRHSSGRFDQYRCPGKRRGS